MLLAVFFVIGIGLTLLTLSFFGIADVSTVLMKSDWTVVLAAVICQLIALALLGARMRIVGRRYGKLSYWQAFKVTSVSMVTDFITPVAKVGGEPLKVMMLKNKFGGSRASALVAVDMLVELFTTAVVVVGILFFLGGRMPVLISTALFVFIMLMVAAVAIFYKIFTSKRWLRHVINWIVKRVSNFKKIEKKDYSVSFRKAVIIMAHDRKTMANALVVSFAQKFFEMLRIWLVFLAFGVFVPFDIVIIVWAFVLVLFLVPWLPGNLGLIEFGSVSAFVLLGVAGTAAASGVILDRFISFWFVLIIGIACLWQSGLSLEHMKKRKRKI